jgi:environmental stress-induced protein Ves
MYATTSPDQFRSITWKNGLGTTTELAISPGDSVSDFAWRLSIAQVERDGPFSDFSGYNRNLVLIEGGGIELQHSGFPPAIDRLDKILDVASFDGGRVTKGVLLAGPIRDLNVMAASSKYEAIVETFPRPIEVVHGDSHPSDILFIYALAEPATIRNEETSTRLEAGHLLRAHGKDTQRIRVEGSNLIAVWLQSKQPSDEKGAPRQPSS